VFSAKWREIHNLVVDGMSLATRWPNRRTPFQRVYYPMVQAGETGGFSTWCWRRSRISIARKGAEIEGADRDDLYRAFVLPRPVGLTVLLVFFIPKFPENVHSVHGTLPLITR